MYDVNIFILVLIKFNDVKMIANLALDLDTNDSDVRMLKNTNVELDC